MRREVCLFNFSLSHLAKCACIIALATLNLSTAVQAVGVKAPGRSFIAIRSIRMAARSMKQLIESISRNENDFPIRDQISMNNSFSKRAVEELCC